jgi:hypothetical protein
MQHIGFAVAQGGFDADSTIGSANPIKRPSQCIWAKCVEITDPGAIRPDAATLSSGHLNCIQLLSVVTSGRFPTG